MYLNVTALGAERISPTTRFLMMQPTMCMDTCDVFDQAIVGRSLEAIKCVYVVLMIFGVHWVLLEDYCTFYTAIMI